MVYRVVIIAYERQCKKRSGKKKLNLRPPSSLSDVETIGLERKHTGLVRVDSGRLLFSTFESYRSNASQNTNACLCRLLFFVVLCSLVAFLHTFVLVCMYVCVYENSVSSTSLLYVRQLQFTDRMNRASTLTGCPRLYTHCVGQ